MSILPKGYKYWTALEPDTRQLTLNTGAEARLADPLFMLSQQWRMGEFRHVEGGVPIATDVAYDAQPVATFTGASGATEIIPASIRTDEILAEPAPLPKATAPARAPLALARDLDATMRSLSRDKVNQWEDIRPEYLAGLDHPNRALRMRARTGKPMPDGTAILAAVERRDARLTSTGIWAELHQWAVSAGGTVRPSLDILVERERIFEPLFPNTQPPVFNLPDSFNLPDIFGRRRDFPGRFLPDDILPMPNPDVAPLPDPPAVEADAFDVSKLGHRGTLWFDGADEGTFAQVTGDTQGCLTWRNLTSDQIPTPAPTQDTARMIPSRLNFPGKPPERYWTLSAKRSDWAAASAGPSELGRLVAGAVITEQSSDWFVVPLTVPNGHLVRIESVAMVTGFGPSRAYGLAAAPQEGVRTWQSFSEADADTIFVMGAVQALAGPIIERATLKPEDHSNLLWLIERVLTDDNGRGATQNEGPAEPHAADANGVPVYTLQIDPAVNWYPLRQVQDGFVPSAFATATGARRTPKGVLGKAIDHIPFGRVPTEGVGLTRRWFMGRDRDGAPRRWIARGVGAAQETATSGLAYDVLHLPGRHS